MTHAIIVGTHLDLSGPLAQWGQATRNGLRMGIDEANAEGGMQGRQIRLIVEDDRYDPAAAASAVRKLVNEDGVFAILSPLGTPTVEASMTQALNHGVLHLFPLMADAQSFHPLHPLKFAVTPPYANDIAAGLDYLLTNSRKRKVAVLYETNAFGAGILDGAQTALARRHLKPAAVVGFPAGATNFRGEIAKLKAARADIVVLGTVVQDTLEVLRAVRTSAWHPLFFLCSAACYTPETTTLGGTLVEGLYAVADVPIPYANDPNAKLRGWAESYQRKFGAPATLQALQGYLNARLFAGAVRKTGVLTQVNYARTLETMAPWTDERLDGLPVKFTPEDHLGVHAGFLARVQKGRWVTQTASLEAN